MAFDNLLGELNDYCLSEFGEDFEYSRVASLEKASPDDPPTIKGVLLSGIELEEEAPLEGSVHADLWIKSDVIDPPLEAGDEINGTAYIYVILPPQNDGGGFIRLPLRQDREVI